MDEPSTIKLVTRTVALELSRPDDGRPGWDVYLDPDEYESHDYVGHVFKAGVRNKWHAESWLGGPWLGPFNTRIQAVSALTVED